MENLKMESSNFTLNLDDFSAQMSNAGSLAIQAQEDEAMDFDIPLFEKEVIIIVPIILAIIGIVGLAGNSLVVMVVKRNPQMCSTITNLFIINLAVADLLFIIFCVPFTAWDYAFPYWPFGVIWCKAVQCLIVGCIYASIYTLVLMSLDRYLAVVHPIRSLSLRTVQNAKRAIIALWTITILLCVPTAITHNVSYGNGDIYLSMCAFQLDEYNLTKYQVTFFLLSCIVPMFIIIILYIHMLMRVWFGSGRNTSKESVCSKKKKVTRMVVIMVIIFALCWTPIQIVLVLKSFNLYSITPAKIIFQIAAHILAYMNSCVNPILYAILSEDFRKTYRRVISCNQQTKRTPDPTADNCSVEQQELTIDFSQLMI